MAKHPIHDGDWPSLLIDDDSSAAMLHSRMENFANIPERHASNGADEETVDALAH